MYSNSRNGDETVALFKRKKYKVYVMYDFVMNVEAERVIGRYYQIKENENFIYPVKYGDKKVIKRVLNAVKISNKTILCNVVHAQRKDKEVNGLSELWELK